MPESNSTEFNASEFNGDANGGQAAAGVPIITGSFCAVWTAGGIGGGTL